MIVLLMLAFKIVKHTFFMNIKYNYAAHIFSWKESVNGKLLSYSDGWVLIQLRSGRTIEKLHLLLLSRWFKQWVDLDDLSLWLWGKFFPY